MATLYRRITTAEAVERILQDIGWSSPPTITDKSRAIGDQLRADAFGIRHAMLSTYDRRPEKRQEHFSPMQHRIPLRIADQLEANRWRMLFTEFSPTWVERLGAWPNGHIQRATQ